MSITIEDRLWGSITIDNNKLIDLLQSKTIERLKWIGQHGPLNHISFLGDKVSSVTRYEHSVGCMILTLKAGGSIDEAIAALLHDIVHTAFSHAFDFLSGSNATSYHEKYKKSLLKQFSKELQSILGNDWKKYLNEKNWPLIKKNNPFAIDIADYTVRDAVAFGMCDLFDVKMMCDQLTVIEDYNNRQLACKTSISSKWWNKLSKKTNSIYMSPWNIALNHYLALGLKVCVDNKTLDMKTLKNVPDSDTESVAMEHILKTEYGSVLENYKNHTWELFDGYAEIPKDWKVVNKFEIRDRIVEPPVINNDYIQYKMINKIKILAFN